MSRVVILLTINLLILIIGAEEDYIINTSKCKIPNFPTHSEEMVPIYTKQDYVNCTNKILLTYTTVESFAVLHINRSVVNDYVGENEDVKCCYRYVLRHGSKHEPDRGIRYTDCKTFHDPQILIRDTVSVRCYNNNTLQLTYENIHQIIRPNDDLLQKTQHEEGAEENSTKPISVLFVVIDSVSRLNLIRTMPTTYKYLKEKKFIEMKGYNKIDDNTFPNFNALLTGFNLKQSYKICKPRDINGLDNCPMIWYDYRKLGYITAYAEDWTSIGTFNYLMKGFTDPPTDYYFKPYFEATELLAIRQLDTMPYCTGPETAGERVLNLAKDFSTTYLTKPTFGIFWMNTFSHNYINTPGSMDNKVKEFFQDISERGVLNESVVIFLSDHGIRFGEIRKTMTGYFEERLPLNFISLPPWFKQKYPLEASNLLKNAQSLTTTFDLHKTLQHLLVLSGKNYTDEASGNPNGISLLKSIPKERSCIDAGIPLEWCTCIGNFRDLATNNSLVVDAKEQIIQFLSELIFTSINVINAKISQSNQNSQIMLVNIEVNMFMPFEHTQSHQGIFRLYKNKLVRLLVIRT